MDHENVHPTQKFVRLMREKSELVEVLVVRS